MKLMTKTLEKRFAQVGSQENVKDPLVIAKFFNPAGEGTWSVLINSIIMMKIPSFLIHQITANVKYFSHTLKNLEYRRSTEIVYICKKPHHFHLLLIRWLSL